MAERIVQLRHILFRVKARVYYQTKLGRFIKNYGWSHASSAHGLRVLSEFNADVFTSHGYRHINDPIIADKLQWENERWTNQSDIIYVAEGNIFIEPEFGLAFLPGKRLITPTKSRAHTYLIPSFIKAKIHQWFKTNTSTVYDSVIHFDGYASKNLYHFFDDALNGLLLILKSNEVSKNIPIVVSERVYKLPYMQYFLSMPAFSTLTWIVQQEKEWIRANRLYKGVASHRLWCDLYQGLAKQITKRPYRRIFLNRKAKFQRRLLNNEAVETILTTHGFKTVYAEDMTYDQQVNLFSEAEYVVALHGAGITNIIYSEMKHVHLLEIFSSSLIHPHYYWFVELLGIHYYDGIAASAFDINWNYKVDEEKFQYQLDIMMSAEHKFSNVTA